MDKKSNFYIDPTAKLDIPLRYLQGCIKTKNEINKKTVLPQKLFIGPYVILGKNATIGERVIIDSHCTIDPNVTIGQDTLIIYRSSIGGDTTIGQECVIGGVIPENCKIGDRCRIFGDIVHSHHDSTMSWDHHDIPEKSVTIFNDSFVGFGATLAGGFNVGPNAYICAGAIITRDVPPFHICCQTNKIIHYSKWKGKLKSNPIFVEKD